MNSPRTPRTHRPTQKLLDSRNRIQKKPRQPSKCHICPGFPLKSNCRCKKRNVPTPSSFQSTPTTTLSPTTPVPNSSSPINFSLSPTPVRNSTSMTSPFVINSTPNLSSTTPVPIPSAMSESTFNFSSGSLFAFPNNFTTQETQPNSYTTINNETANSQDNLSNAASNSSDFAIDPQLLEQSNSDQSDDEEISPENLGSKNKKVVASVKNPLFGLVEGVKKGSAVYDVARTRKLPDKIKMQGKSTSRYRRELPDIIARCERLAVQCDVYMMLACQQASGSSAAVHYTSPRLRREAKQDTLEMVQHYQSLMNKLLLARRQDALIAIKEKEMAEKEVEKAQELTRLAEERIKAQQTQLEAQNILLQKLQAKMEGLEAQRRENRES